LSGVNKLILKVGKEEVLEKILILDKILLILKEWELVFILKHMRMHLIYKIRNLVMKIS
jgi:hypothetical protein